MSSIKLFYLYRVSDNMAIKEIKDIFKKQTNRQVKSALLIFSLNGCE